MNTGKTLNLIGVFLVGVFLALGGITTRTWEFYAIIMLLILISYINLNSAN